MEVDIDGHPGGEGVDDLCGAKALHESSLLSSTLWSAGSDVSFFFPSCNEFRNLKTQTIPSSCAREYICEQPVFVKKSTD